jgi:cytochrome P450
MDDRQLRDEVLNIFQAGHETSAIALSMCFDLLARHPEVRERLETELDSVLGGRPACAEDCARLPYLDMVIHETLRLRPPVWSMGRFVAKEVQLGGYTLPPGIGLVFSQWVTHRNPKWFPEPESFRPERWENGFVNRLPRYAYFPFGRGPRLCIGYTFALMEMALMLSTICRRFRLEAPPGRTVQLQPSLLLRPVGGVPMRLSARRGSLAFTA